MTEPGTVPGQRRALEVTGVLPEQLRVLRSPPGRLDYRLSSPTPRCPFSLPSPDIFADYLYEKA